MVLRRLRWPAVHGQLSRALLIFPLAEIGPQRFGLALSPIAGDRRMRRLFPRWPVILHRRDRSGRLTRRQAVVAEPRKTYWT